MSEPSSCTGFVQAMFAGGLAFVGVAIGGVALTLTAYLNSKRSGDTTLYTPLKVALWFLTCALLLSTITAGFAFAILVLGATGPKLLLWLTPVTMGGTLAVAIVAVGALMLAVYRLP